jgi:hypothetical protein
MESLVRDAAAAVDGGDGDTSAIATKDGNSKYMLDN